MGKAAQGKQQRTAREKLAAQRAAERRSAAARRRLLIMSGSVAVVIALVVGFIVVKSNEKPAAAIKPETNAQIVRELGDVSPAKFDTVGVGNASGLKAISGEPELTKDGKPEVLFIGAEFCPWCAAERWAIATTLSRFGTLTATDLIHSSPDDSFPNTPTLSFVGSSYTSKYIAFVPVEWENEDRQVLQQPTAAELALWNKYSGNAFPFLDIANRYLLSEGAQYNPGDLAGLTWSQVVADVQDPSSQVGKDIDGAANVLTAGLCKLTNGQPGNVCSSAGVKAAESSVLFDQNRRWCLPSCDVPRTPASRPRAPPRTHRA
jgi:hypothetical protein